MRRFLGFVMAAALATASFGQIGYARRSETIRAGVVVIGGQARGGVPANFYPYVWFNLDNNRTAKPAGWTFANPRPATIATTAMAARWSAIASVVGGPGLAAGDRLTKRHGGYWEVSLADTSEDQIADYDVLYLAMRAGTALNSFERERLRKFVDQGGVLWVEIIEGAGAGTPDVLNGLPIPVRPRAVSASDYGIDLAQPLLRYPNRITPTEALALNYGETGTAILPFTLDDVGLDALRPQQTTIEADARKLRPIAVGLGGSLVVGSIGDGFMVVSNRGESRILNRGVVGNGSPEANAQAIAGETIRDAFHNAAAKLALNLVSLRTGFGAVSGGSQKSGSSPIDTGAPMLGSFTTPTPSVGAGEFHPPVLYKGLLVVTGGNRVFVYDANPGNDVDGDGDPDDGERDYARGTGYDLLWSSAAGGGTLSAPTCAEVPGAPVKDQILVTTVAGELVAFDAFNLGADGRVRSGPASPLYTVSPPGGAGTSTEAYAPTVQEGYAYMADTVGSSNRVARVWVADLATGTNVRSTTDWIVGGTGTNLIRETGGAPTVGYVPVRDNSGAMDRVLYLATKPRPGGSGPSATAGISSVWLGTRGESPTEWQTRTVGSNTELIVTTRAALQGLAIYRPDAPSGLGVKLAMLKPSGDPYSAAEMNAMFTGAVSQPSPGTLVFGMHNTAVLPPEAGVRLDYSLDWGTGNAAATNLLVRGQIYLPDDADLTRTIFPSIALAPNGNLFVVSGAPSKGGSLFCLREEGRGTFNLLYRWDLYPEHTIRMNQANPVTYAETLFDEDPVAQLAGPFLVGRLGNLAFKSGPAVRGDTVYVVASATKNVFIDITILLAFDANPAAREITVGSIPDRFSIVQPDIGRSATKNDPRTFNSFQMNQFRYEKSDDGTKGVVRFETLMTTNRGPITNALNTSQPVIIRRAGAPDQLVEPGATGGHWSPMRWYMVLNGYRNSSPPFVSGQSLFIVGDSVIPSLFENGFTTPPTRRDALVFALAAGISPNDAFLASNSQRPWMKQAYTLKLGGPDVVDPNPAILWPQYKGSSSFEDFIVRFRQTVLKGSSDAFGIIGGEGGVYAWTSQGVYGFRKADLVIADEGRVGRYDTVGNPEFSIDSTYFGGESAENMATNKAPLVRPTRAYPVGSNEWLVVDTGANRIVRVDATGKETRAIEGFRLDPARTVDGYAPNDPLTLNRPRDVALYTSYETNPTGVTAPQALEFWERYVVADTGNHRVFEIVDRYAVDPTTRGLTGVIARGVLVWHSPMTLTGKKFEYTNVARAWIEDGANSRFVFAAGVSNVRPTAGDFGLAPPSGTAQENNGNGGIVIFDGANSQVVGQILVPAIAAGTFYVANDGGFTSLAQDARAKPLANLQSLSMRVRQLGGNPILTMMIADGTGFYEVAQTAPGVWTTTWMMPREAYLALRRSGTDALLDSNPVELNAVYARRLDSGDLLLVNGYSGRTRGGGRFLGEVIQIAEEDYDPTKRNLGFKTSSLVFELPPIQGARGLSSPVFADRR